MGRCSMSHSLECLGANAISTRSANTWESSKEDVTLVTWLAIHQSQRPIESLTMPQIWLKKHLMLNLMRLIAPKVQVIILMM